MIDLSRLSNSTILQSLRKVITNISFKTNMEQFIQLGLIQQNLQIKQGYYLLGQRYDRFQDFKKDQEHLIWSTYRQNIQTESLAFSDVGWGCLLRVGQMIIANALLKQSSIKDEQHRKQILKQFCQDWQASYSLLNFIKIGQEIWNRKAGDWYSMTQVAVMIQTLQQQNEAKQKQNFKVKVYNQNIDQKELRVIFDKKIQSQSQQARKISEKNEQKLQQIPRFDSEYLTISSPASTRKDILLIITDTFSAKQTKQDEQRLLSLMELPTFSGCLGGVPEKARYIIGKHKNKLFYMDPHYVQSAVNLSSLEDQYETFRCKKIRSMKSMCFYLKSEQDLNELMRVFDRQNYKMKEDNQFIINSQQINQQQTIIIEDDSDIELLQIDESQEEEYYQILQFPC